MICTVIRANVMMFSQYPEVVQRLMKIANNMRDDLGDNLTRRKPTGQRQHGVVNKDS